MKRTLILCSLLCSCVTPNQAYVDADAATLGVIGPRYRAYIATDQALSEQQRARHERLLDSWALRVKAAQGAMVK